MTLTLTPVTGTRLLALAERRGQTPEAVIDAFVAREAAKVGPPPSEEASPTVLPLTPTAALFAQWTEEDRTDDPEEIARRQREGDGLLARLQENRLSLHCVNVCGEGRNAAIA